MINIVTEPEREQKEDKKHKSTSKSPKKYVILIHVVFLCAPQQQKMQKFEKIVTEIAVKISFPPSKQELIFSSFGQS